MISDATLINQGKLKDLKILMIVENLPVPFDRRVWLEARTLKRAGASVSIICPTGRGYEKKYEFLEGIHIYRHFLPKERASAFGYLLEYLVALYHEMRLALLVFFRHGIDVIHACNPPDLIFLVALPFKILGRKFIFDHHDVNPELYEAKFGRRDFFWKLMLFLERLTFYFADISIATNESYKSIAISRGKMKPERVFVVRSGPDLSALKSVPPSEAFKCGRKFLVGYVGVIGEQEGIDLLLTSVSHIVFNLKRTDIQFAIAGSGPALEPMRSLAKMLEIEEYVSFLGRIPDTQLFEMLSTSDVCVNPDRVTSMNDISTMNKILEYMAFGKPIVQFDVKEGRYSAQSSSLYASANDPIDFAKCILDLVDDPDLRRKMGNLGYERVNRDLCWETQISHLLEAYSCVR